MKKYLYVLLLLTAACSPSDHTAASASDGKEQAEYRVLTEHSYPPFIMHADNGEVSGFEYDVLQAVAAKQGFTLKYYAHPWKGLFQALDENRADIVSSGITITDERKKQMDFSNPYFETESVLLVGKKFPKNIKNFSQLNGISVTVKSGTSQDEILLKNGAVPVYTDTTWQTVSAILNNKTDAALGDFGVMSHYAKRYRNEGMYMVRDPNTVKEHLGFGIKKGNTALQSQINNGLNEIRKDGTYDKIYQKWFSALE